MKSRLKKAAAFTLSQPLSWSALDASASPYIWQMIDKTGLGVSEYGKLLDAAGAKAHIMNHRLIGHHLVFDFPYLNPDLWWDHIEHVGLSDFPTKQGIPIIPGKILEGTSFYKHAAKIGDNWNQINLLQSVAGGLSIYSGIKCLKKSVSEQEKQSNSSILLCAGSGALEVAIGVKSCNVLLVFGGGLKLTTALNEYMKDELQVSVNSRIQLISLENRITNSAVDSRIALRERRIKFA